MPHRPKSATQDSPTWYRVGMRHEAHSMVLHLPLVPHEKLGFTFDPSAPPPCLVKLVQDGDIYYGELTVDLDSPSLESTIDWLLAFNTDLDLLAAPLRLRRKVKATSICEEGDEVVFEVQSITRM